MPERKPAMPEPYKVIDFGASYGDIFLSPLMLSDKSSYEEDRQRGMFLAYRNGTNGKKIPDGWKNRGVTVIGERNFDKHNRWVLAYRYLEGNHQAGSK